MAAPSFKVDYQRIPTSTMVNGGVCSDCIASTFKKRSSPIVIGNKTCSVSVDLPADGWQFTLVRAYLAHPNNSLANYPPPNMNQAGPESISTLLNCDEMSAPINKALMTTGQACTFGVYRNNVTNKVCFLSSNAMSTSVGTLWTMLLVAVVASVLQQGVPLNIIFGIVR
jgi:hypothetical protein